MKWITSFLFITLVSCSSSRSTPSVCEILKIDNCNNSKRGLARSAGASLPSVNSAAFNNPAAISLNRGWGIESIHYGGEAQVGIVTGTGRIGAAISNFPNDGTFFGNTAIEDANSYRVRRVEGERFKEEKVVLATGVNLVGGKKKKGIKLDMGLMYRKHSEVDRAFGGGGLTISYNNLVNFGAATYKDVHYLDLQNKTVQIADQSGNLTEVTYGTNPALVFETPYQVNSVTAGLKFSKLAVDYIRFTTIFELEDYEIAESSIYNISYFYKQWIFSYGRRFEKSYKEKYEDERFISDLHKSATFLGAQFATGNFLFGAFTNYYLLNELSLGLTYFL